MRFLIVAASVLACAVAVPSGLYGHGLLGHGAPLAYSHGAIAPLALGHAAPTISSGDIQGAAIDAHVVASDHTRAAVDAVRNQHDQASDYQGRAINAAEEHAWSSVNAAQTAHAALDGHAAGIAPIAAKQLAGHGIAPIALAGHGIAAPYAGHGIAAPYAGHGLAAPLVAGHGLAAPWAAGYAGSHSVATSSLHQTHPAPVHGIAIAHGVAPGYGYGHGLSHY